MSTTSYVEYWLHRFKSAVDRGPNKLNGGTFYKYRSLGDSESEAERRTLLKRLKDMIVDQKVYFSKPSQFNDPFDCRPRISLGYSESRYQQWIKNIVEQNSRSGSLSPSFKERLTRNIALMQKDPELRNQIFHDILDSDTAIFSMSKTYKNLLQWSYYADSHKGLCLQYSIGSDFCGAQLYEVEYVRFRHVVDIVKTAKNIEYMQKEVLRAATTKGKAWSHEKEVRAIRVGSGEYACPRPTLTAVGFGLKTSPANKTMVREWVEQAGLSVDFFDMRDNPTNFGLHREPQ